MPVYGLVLTLEPAEPQRERALCALRGHPRLLLGAPSGGRLPVALECDDLDEEERLLAWLSALEGVAFVDVAFVDFSDLEPSALPPRRRRRAPETSEGVR